MNDFDKSSMSNLYRLSTSIKLKKYLYIIRIYDISDYYIFRDKKIKKGTQCLLRGDFTETTLPASDLELYQLLPVVQSSSLDFGVDQRLQVPDGNPVAQPVRGRADAPREVVDQPAVSLLNLLVGLGPFGVSDLAVSQTHLGGFHVHVERVWNAGVCCLLSVIRRVKFSTFFVVSYLY